MNLIVNLKSLKRQVKNNVRRLHYAAKFILDKNKKNNALEIGKIHKSSHLSYSGNVPIQIITSDSHHCMTTFFDVEPLSSCGKYLAVTSVPFIQRIPFPGDSAQICIYDLENQTYKAIYNTKGWGAQLGANVQWGKSKDVIYCNDFIEGEVRGVEISLDSLSVRYLDGPIFTLDSNKKYSYSANLKNINGLIPGYGVPEPIMSKYRSNEKLTTTDGIWRTNLATGKKELFLSIKEIVDGVSEAENISGGTHYVFNTKINAQNTKLFIVLFSLGSKGRIGPTLQLIVYDFASQNLSLVLKDSEWSKGGHHPNWMPNGRDILMNLKHPDNIMRFVKINSDTLVKELLVEDVVGGGHPSTDLKCQYILTDAYISEGLGDREGKVPIRLIDIAEKVETHIARIYTKRLDGPCRIDPHPVWSHKHDKIIWNGIENGKRRVFIADMTKLLNKGN
jgi:hypothetical protein